MAKVGTQHTLTWSMELLDRGLTCFTLYDSTGRQWGWVINVPHPYWLAHIGDFGQCAANRLPDIPIANKCENFSVLELAKTWVEESLATRWSEIEEAVK
jgi:hypothetical protein